MNRRLVFLNLVLLDVVVLLGVPLPAQETFAMDRRQKIDGQIAPARPGIVAEQEEFKAAERKGTVAAFEFFLKRHPHGPVAKAAQEALDRLRAHKQPSKR